MDDWRPVDGFPNYSVNSLGWVRNDATGRLKASKVNQYGVVYVGLQRDYLQRQRGLALIVARAFVEFVDLPTEIFDTPINRDGNRFNCSVDNLLWRPRWFARQYNRQFREPYDDPIRQPIQEQASGEIFANSMEAAIHYGLLERDVVLSVLHNTVTWPLSLRFLVLD